MIKNKNSNRSHILDCLIILSKPLYKWTKLLVRVGHQDYSHCRLIQKRIKRIVKKRHSSEVQLILTPDCLDDFSISNYIHGTLDAEDLAHIQGHLTNCDLCLARTWAILNRKNTIYNELTYHEPDKTSRILFDHSDFRGIKTYVKFVAGFIFLIIILFIFFILQKYKTQKSISMENLQRLRSEPNAIIEIPSFSWNQKENRLIFRWKNIEDSQFYIIQIWEVSTGRLIFKQKTTSNFLEVPIKNTFYPKIRYLWSVEAYAYQRLLYDFPPMTFFIDSLLQKQH